MLARRGRCLLQLNFLYAEASLKFEPGIPNRMLPGSDKIQDAAACLTRETTAGRPGVAFGRCDPFRLQAGTQYANI